MLQEKTDEVERLRQELMNRETDMKMLEYETYDVSLHSILSTTFVR